MTKRLTLERSGPLATLWLDRPDKRNALDGALMKELGEVLDEIGADGSIRCVLLRGRGPVFSSGIDHSLLTEVASATARSRFLQFHHQIQDVFHRMARLNQPVIAMLHGACIGMGLELALAADLRLVSEDCVLGLPEIAFGLIPDVGGTTRLVRAVGEPRARELILTGRVVRARTAERYGLVHEVAGDAAALEQLATKYAEQLVPHSPAALGLAKSLCQISGDADAATSFRLEGLIQQALLGQPDFAERMPAALAFIKAQLGKAR